ncbi:MAG: zinc ribbon domain-containing protein, partial [Atopobiaceae bacterium]|nr:zinc ribbon domain-containing protein [Atopobiaceae bacterium]
MHCPYCGKPVDDGIPYCPWCGGGLREDTSSPIPSAVFDDEPVTPSNDIPQERTVARPAPVADQRASSPQPVPTRTRRSTPRYTDDPDNNGGGRLLMGLVVAAAA